MIRLLICILACVILVAAPVSGCGENTKSAKTIDYKVLRQWSIPAGGVGMELLVSTDTTKEQALELASSLRSKYLSQGYIAIQIFDSQDAYNHRADLSYPEGEFYKHYLVNITRNPKTGNDEIVWVADGRGY